MSMSLWKCQIKRSTHFYTCVCVLSLWYLENVSAGEEYFFRQWEHQSKVVFLILTGSVWSIFIYNWRCLLPTWLNLDTEWRLTWRRGGIGRRERTKIVRFVKRVRIWPNSQNMRLKSDGHPLLLSHGNVRPQAISYRPSSLGRWWS